MKNSIDFLPDDKQQDLHQLIRLIRDEMPDAALIILFGSYARNTYVDYDQRTEFGVPTYFISDYDLLILTSSAKWTSSTPPGVTEKILTRFFKDKQHQFHPYPQFLVDSVERFNDAVEQGRYFYSDILREGVLLYDSGKYKLAEIRSLNYSEVKELAKEYFDEKFEYASDFLLGVTIYYNQGKYKIASFVLHQAAENFLHTITLVYSLYQYKLHQLEALIGHSKQFTLEIGKVFPRDTPEEKRLFNLLQEAYIQAPHNIRFVVTREDIEALISKVERLRDLTERLCRDRLAYYDRMIRTT